MAASGCTSGKSRVNSVEVAVLWPSLQPPDHAHGSGFPSFTLMVKTSVRSCGSCKFSSPQNYGAKSSPYVPFSTGSLHSRLPHWPFSFCMFSAPDPLFFSKSPRSLLVFQDFPPQPSYWTSCPSGSPVVQLDNWQVWKTGWRQQETKVAAWAWQLVN